MGLTVGVYIFLLLSLKNISNYVFKLSSILIISVSLVKEVMEVNVIQYMYIIQ
jgi:hypothetical protein